MKITRIPSLVRFIAINCCCCFVLFSSFFEFALDGLWNTDPEQSKISLNKEKGNTIKGCIKSTNCKN